VPLHFQNLLSSLNLLHYFLKLPFIKFPICPLFGPFRFFGDSIAHTVSLFSIHLHFTILAPLIPKPEPPLNALVLLHVADIFLQVPNKQTEQFYL
jgi:hypothetical protein